MEVYLLIELIFFHSSFPLRSPSAGYIHHIKKIYFLFDFVMPFQQKNSTKQVQCVGVGYVTEIENQLWRGITNILYFMILLPPDSSELYHDNA